ncbi:MAG: BNR-4 repeat-containing protein [Verrucomicrobiota bacterium]
MNKHTILPSLTLLLVLNALRLNADDKPTATSADKASAAAFAASANEPHQLKNQKFHTSTLFSADSLNRSGMGECVIQVFKGNVYGVYGQQGDERIMVAKVPLDGSAAVTMPLVKGTDTEEKGYRARKDNHSIYIIAVDGSGYIHVCGGMHSALITYWRSDRPENVSSFSRYTPDDKQPPGKQPCPIAGHITFPHFFSDHHGQLFWSCHQGCGPLCSYDETTKLWTALGSKLGTMASSAKERDYISFFYEDNKSYSTPDPDRVKGGMTSRGFDLAWDSKNRMHMAIGLLNIDAHAKGRHTGSATDILYAYSDDGGKTVFKSNGKQIQLPIRAEAGPNQGEVILTANDVSVSSQPVIAVDKEDRPVIWCHSYKTGDHCFRLESGQWVDHPTAPVAGSISTDPGGVMVGRTKKDCFTRFWNLDGRNVQTLDFPVLNYDKAYYQHTGELIWTSLSGKSTSSTYTIHRTVFDRVSK